MALRNFKNAPAATGCERHKRPKAMQIVAEMCALGSQSEGERVTNIRHSIAIIFHKFSRRYPGEVFCWAREKCFAAPPASLSLAWNNKNRSQLNNFNCYVVSRSTWFLRHKINVDSEAHEKLSNESFSSLQNEWKLRKIGSLSSC